MMEGNMNDIKLRNGIKGRGRGRNVYHDQRQTFRQETVEAGNFMAKLHPRFNPVSANHSDNDYENGRQSRRFQDALSRRSQSIASGDTTSAAVPSQSPDSSTGTSNPADFPSQVIKQRGAHASTVSSVESTITDSGSTTTTCTTGNEEIQSGPKGQDMKAMTTLFRLNQYKAEMNEDIERRRLEKESKARKHRTSLQSLPLFIPEKVNEAIRKQKKALPIYAVKEKLVDVIRKNQIVIVTGSTGCGKSTQIPQYIAEAGLHGNGRIVVTQTRRVAAKALATRVAEECGVKVGTTVGYSVKLDRSYNEKTVIKFLTDGLLVKECIRDRYLSTYSVVIIDEAHERTISTDVCLGLLKVLAEKRPDLRIIISSATLDVHKFSKFFNNATVFEIVGKLHKIKTIYQYADDDDSDRVENVFDEIVNRILTINMTNVNVSGDILVFLAGQDEIDTVWDKLSEKLKEKQKSGIYMCALKIVPCCSSLSFHEQQKIFEPTPYNHRKVVLATNIAETSLTIEGIKYVIDPGYFKRMEYNPESGISALVRQTITKFQAEQRRGRAGRTENGTCYRLYSAREFKYMQEAPDPEITRSNLESVVLDILGMGKCPFDFPFIDPPSEDAIYEAWLHLKELKAVNANFQLISLGRRMSEFPLSPRLAKVVLESQKLGCEEDVLKIAGLLSVSHHSLFKRVRRGYETDAEWKILKTKVKMIKKRFKNTDGDILTLLKIYDTYAWQGFSKVWCRKNYIQSRLMHEAEEIRKELTEILANRALDNTVADEVDLKPKHVRPVDPDESGVKSESIRRAFTAGFFRQIARKIDYKFEVVGNLPYFKDVYLHRSSDLECSSHQPYIIYLNATIRKNRKGKSVGTCIGGNMKIEPAWVFEYAPEIAREIKNWVGISRRYLGITFC